MPNGSNKQWVKLRAMPEEYQLLYEAATASGTTIGVFALAAAVAKARTIILEPNEAPATAPLPVEVS